MIKDWSLFSSWYTLFRWISRDAYSNLFGWGKSVWCVNITFTIIYIQTFVLIFPFIVTIFEPLCLSIRVTLIKCKMGQKNVFLFTPFLSYMQSIVFIVLKSYFKNFKKIIYNTEFIYFFLGTANKNVKII